MLPQSDVRYYPQRHQHFQRLSSESDTYAPGLYMTPRATKAHFRGDENRVKLLAVCRKQHSNSVTSEAV